MKTIILNTDSLLNPGDTGIVLAQVKILRRLFPGLAVSLTSRTPSLDRRFFEPLGVSVLPPLIPAPSLWRGFGRKVICSAEQALAVSAKRRLWQEIRACRFVVSSGGGPFYSNRRTVPGPTFYQNILHVRLAQALGKPVVFFPQSFGPFGSPLARRSALGMLCHPRTAKIFVRESLSFDALCRIVPASVRGKIELCPDMALRLEPEEPGEADPRITALPRPRLALTVRGWNFPEAETRAERKMLFERYLQAFRAAARYYGLRRKGSVILVPHTRGPGDFEDDRIVSRRLWNLLADDLPAKQRVYMDFCEDAPPSRLMDVYSKSDIVLATRTHSAIFALLSGVPAVSVHYQPKGLGIMTMLGRGDYSLPIGALSETALVESLEAAAGRWPEQRGQVAERIAALRAEIEARLGRVLEEVVRPA